MTLVGEPNGRFELRAGTAASALEVEWAVRTDVGLRRETNEDSAVTVAGLLAVADGLGGHEAGDLASAAVVKRLAEATARQPRRSGFVELADIIRALQRASLDIAGLTRGRSRGSGSTVTGMTEVAGLGGGSALLVFNIGDSRAYRQRDGHLDQLTTDHSLVQELVRTGRLDADQAERHPDANVITRAIGFETHPVPDHWLLSAEPGTRLLICTDGLTKELSDTQISALLGAGGDAAVTAETLVARALEAGGNDNVTVIVADIAVLEPPVAFDTDRAKQGPA